MNVTANGEQPQNGNGSGPLSWIGTAHPSFNILEISSSKMFL